MLMPNNVNCTRIWKNIPSSGHVQQYNNGFLLQDSFQVEKLSRESFSSIDNSGITLKRWLLVKCIYFLLGSMFFSNVSFSQVLNTPPTKNLPAMPGNTLPAMQLPAMQSQNQNQELFPDLLTGTEMYYKATMTGEIEIFLVKYFGCTAVVKDSTEKVTVQESMANMLTAQPLLKLVSVSDESKLMNVNCQGFTNGCVKKAVYSGKVKVMNPMMGGYDVTLGYCCWDINPNLVNIQGVMQAKNQGLSLSMHIPELSFGDTNSSPVFINPPVILTCKDQLISFYSTANDNDRDSLAYEFSNIDDYKSVNGTPNPEAPRVYPGQPVNKTFPGSRPPFQNILYQKDYSYEKPMKGKQISIDSKTGEVTVKPDTIGDFLIGVSVKEYRQKKLLGTYQRVFKIKVVS